MKKKLFFFITVLFLLTIPSVFAQKNEKSKNEEDTFIDTDEAEVDGVMSLFQINKLINDRYLSEALRQLHIYIEKKPDYFDNAQTLIRRIMRLRQEYSVLAEKAIKVNNEHPEDDETPMKIVEKMRQIEKDPPLEIRRMIAMLEEMHAYKYYAKQYDDVQKQVAEYITQKDYTNAVLENKKSFENYKEQFEEEWADYPEIIQKSEELLAELNTQVDVITENELRVMREVDTFIALVDMDDYSSAKAQYPYVVDSFNAFISVYVKIADCKTQYEDLYLEQQKIKPEIGYTDASYLPFMLKSINGTQDKPYSGILGVLNNLYDTSVENMKTAVANQIVNYSNGYLAVLPENILDSEADYDSLLNKDSFIVPITNYAALGVDVNSIYELIETKSSVPDYDYSVNYIAGLSGETPDIFGLAQKVRAEIDTQGYIFSQLERSKNTPGFDLTVYADGLFESATKINSYAVQKSDYQPQNFEWGQKYAASNPVLDFTDFTVRYNNHLNQIFEKAELAIVDVWTRLSDSYNWSIGDYAAIAQGYSDNEDKFISGLASSISSEDYASITASSKALLEYSKKAKVASGNKAETVYYYPDLTKTMATELDELTRKYTEDIQKKQDSISSYMNSNAASMENPQVVKLTQETYNNLETVKQQLKGYNTKAKASLRRANERLESAALAKRNADALFEEANDAYKRGELDKAEDLLQEASSKYAEALSYAESHELRNTSDSQNLTLSSQIVYAKNEIVVKESRRLYNEARDAQNHDRYDDAESYISAAINKWSETHDEKNAEFEDFKELINTAISMKTGRDLYPSDPLYAEMSQLLSVAYQYYDAGNDAIKKGNKEEGNEALKNASDSLARLKKVYPLNQEASLLLLKIERLQDPKKFNAEFKQRITIAKEKCNVASTQTEGYNDLLAYSNFEPDWPGLKNDIYNIEIKLGMRQKPVDNSAITKAQRYYNDARKQFNAAGNDEKKLKAALDTVEQALALNPNYTAAEGLKDSINTKLGGNAPLVLTAADQDLLERARSAFQANRIDEANSYMRLLLNHNPNYEKIKSVNDLKRRIEANL